MNDTNRTAVKGATELPAFEIPALVQWHDPLEFETLPVHDARALVVDDSPSVCKALATILDAMGIGSVVTANSGRQALHELLARDFDIILLDVAMPDMDGFETARLIRGRPCSAQIPIIFVTAAEKTEVAQLHGYTLGAVDYIYAPVAPDVLRAKVRAFLSLYRANRQLKEWAEALDRNNAELAGKNRELKEQSDHLSAANEELEAFSYSVSHDLRAPLRAIEGFSRKLADHAAGQLDDEGRHLLKVVMDSAQHMGQLICDVLAFSRVGRQEILLSRVDMDTLAHAVLAELRQADDKRAVEASIAPLPAAHGDPAMLRQVWSNLLGNAWKFSRGRIPARIEVGARAENNENVYWVKDNGVGFDMQYASKLFGVFQRLHGQEEFEGTGAGLAIVHRILLRHGGRIWGEGKVGAGATFWFALPAVAPVGSATEAP